MEQNPETFFQKVVEEATGRARKLGHGRTEMNEKVSRRREVSLSFTTS